MQGKGRRLMIKYVTQNLQKLLHSRYLGQEKNCCKGKKNPYYC